MEFEYGDIVVLLSKENHEMIHAIYMYGSANSSYVLLLSLIDEYKKTSSSAKDALFIMWNTDRLKTIIRHAEYFLDLQ